MGKPWFGKVVYDTEGVVKEHEFKTEAEAKAYCLGFSDAKETVECEDEDILESYFADYSQDEATIEN